MVLEFREKIEMDPIIRIKFGYKPVCNQFVTIYYVTTNKIIHMYFSHMTYLMIYVTSLNNICGWSYKLSRSRF